MGNSTILDDDLEGEDRRKKRAELNKLREFKAYVHKRLDAMGVPHHPEGPHGKEGCRVGDRLDWVASRLQSDA